MGTLRQWLGYFLKLGATGFGGPIVMCNYMQRDLVEKRRWVSESDFLTGLAVSKFAPGPMATQLAIYLGWLRAGWIGGTLAGIALLLPSFLMVIAFAEFYKHYGELAWVKSVSFGIGGVIIAVMVKSAYALTRRTLSAKDKLLWLLFIVGMVTTVVDAAAGVWAILGSGVIVMLKQSPPTWLKRRDLRGLVPLWLLGGFHGTASGGLLAEIFGYFFKIGAVVFGSGLVIIPFLHGGVVEHYHWLTEQQFLDSVAVGMITPGPIVITAAFIGSLVAGPLGGLVATCGIILPCYLLIVVPAPYYKRIADYPSMRAFIDGVTAAAIGAIGGGAILLGITALHEPLQLLIGGVALALAVRFTKLPDPLLIAAGALVGLLVR